MANYTVAWDETVPAGTEDISQGDNRITEEKGQLRERLASQHSNITGTAGDALLSHLAGKCTILFVGTTDEIVALSGILGAAATQCTLAFDTTLKCIKYYNGTAWVILTFDWTNIWATDKAVHTHATNAQGGALSFANVTMLADPVQLISWTADTAWTDVDIDAYVGTDTAVIAILQMELSITAAVAGVCSSIASLKKHDATVTEALLQRLVGACRYPAVMNTSGMFLVGLDTHLFQTKLVTTGTTPTTITLTINLIGYIK